MDFVAKGGMRLESRLLLLRRHVAGSGLFLHEAAELLLGSLETQFVDGLESRGISSGFSSNAATPAAVASRY